jgi:hypothetical protein
MQTCDEQQKTAARDWLHDNIGIVDNHHQNICTERSAWRNNALIIMFKLRSNVGEDWDSTKQQAQIKTHLWISSATTSRIH